MALADYERAFLGASMENLSASIAAGMRAGLDAGRLVEDDQQLTELGRTWVRGFLTGQLAVLRGAVTGNPNLDREDVAEVEELTDAHEAAVAAELYA